MLEYYRADASQVIDFNKTVGFRKCIICNYSYFLEVNFKFQQEVCIGYRNLTQKTINFTDFGIPSVKENDHRIQFWVMS